MPNDFVGMPQTRAAADLLYALECAQNYDPLEVLDAAEELARNEGALSVDSDHVHRAIAAMAVVKERVHG